MVEPLRNRHESWMREISFEQAPNSRQMHQITGFVVPPPRPREDAEDLAVALRREDRCRAKEGGAIEVWKGGEVALRHRAAQFDADIAASILEQRYEIVAWRTAHRVLKIEQSATPHAETMRQQH